MVRSHAYFSPTSTLGMESIATCSSSVWLSLKVSTLILFSVCDADLLGEKVRHLLDDAFSRILCNVVIAHVWKAADFVSFPSHDRQTFKDPALLSDSSNSKCVKEHISSDNFFCLPTALKTFVNLLGDLSSPQTQQKLTLFHL